MKHWIILGSAVQGKVYSVTFHILISRTASEAHDLSRLMKKNHTGIKEQNGITSALFVTPRLRKHAVSQNS